MVEVMTASSLVREAVVERVRDARDELEAVLLVARGWIIQKAVGDREVGADAAVDGQRQTAGKQHGVGVRVIERRGEDRRLRKYHLPGEIAQIVFTEGSADQVLVFCCDLKGLHLVVNVELDVEILNGALQDAITNAAAEDLLEVEGLGVVVVERSICKNIELWR